MAELTVRGLRFHVQKLGWEHSASAPTVLFLHGLVMDNLASWYFTSATAVAHHARVLLMDLRGHGRSERPADGYGISSMLEDIGGVLDACGVTTPVTVVGNSFGGLLATGLAIHAPRRVNGLILVEAHLSDRAFGAEMSATLRLTGEDRDRAIATHFASWLGRHSQRKANRLAKNARELVYGTTLVEDLESSESFSEESLRKVSVPTLALYGQHSDIREKGGRIASLLPQCHLQEFPGCSHSILWEATTEVTEAIVSFVVERTAREMVE